MPTFEYQATDAQGNSSRGNVLSRDLTSAIEDLKRRGMSVQKIEVANSVNDPLNDYPPSQPSPAPAPIYQAPIYQESVQQVSSYANQVPMGSDPSQNYLSPPVTEAPRQQNFEKNQTYANQMNPGPVVAGPPMGPRSYIQTSILGPLAGKAALKDVGFFLRQLGTMIEAGVPIVQTLTTLSEQARDPRIKVIMEDCQGQVKAGRPISFALQRYPESISSVCISLISAGEQGGFLDKSLAQCSVYIDREIELRNLYRRLTFYPKMIFISSFFVIGFTNSIIASLGKTGGLTSPLSTGTWIVLAIIALGIWLFLRIGLANPAIRRVWDKLILKIPVLGKTLHQLAMARFGRAFGTLYSGGVPIVQAMKLSADACGNEELRARMYPHFQTMERGGGIYRTFRDTGAFSPIVLDMVGTGETTGNLELMLTKVAQYYEDEAATKQMLIASVVGLVVFLLVGIYIGIMVVQFYTGYSNEVMSYSK